MTWAPQKTGRLALAVSAVLAVGIFAADFRLGSEYAVPMAYFLVVCIVAAALPPAWKFGAAAACTLFTVVAPIVNRTDIGASLDQMVLHRGLALAAIWAAAGLVETSSIARRAGATRPSSDQQAGYTIDLDGRIQSWSVEAVDLLGFTGGEIIGHSESEVRIPRQSRGPLGVSRSKRLCGDADAAPLVWSHLAGGY